MNVRPCPFGGCNGSIYVKGGTCNRCRTVDPYKDRAPQEPQTFDIGDGHILVAVDLEPVIEAEVMDSTTCDHCLMIVPTDEAVPGTRDGVDVLRCYSCGTGLPYDEFKRRKDAGLPLKWERYEDSTSD